MSAALTQCGAQMRLSDFILANREPILAEWEDFARTCEPASAPMGIVALRDHANEMLTVIAADLATSQGSAAQAEKSKGHADSTEDDDVTAAEEHGAGRAVSGFTIEQMVAEYRALRASVIRLWTREQGELRHADIEDLTRFNEAIDQSLAESVSQFNDDVEKAKETFLAMLGHDLRLPLGAIYMSAAFMLDTGELGEPNRTLVERIARSSKRTISMVGDLLDFTRSRLGGGIPVERAEVELITIVGAVVDELAAANPERPIRLDSSAAEQRGEWDSARLSQAIGNLLGNAVQHGAAGTPIVVEISGDDQQVTVSVRSQGNVIPPERLDGIFNPTHARLTPRDARAMGPSGSLGLGLYIAERIVSAHGGRMGVESTEESGTTFTMRLPRTAPTEEGE
jgi:signal transduction histidine kinase